MSKPSVGVVVLLPRHRREEVAPAIDVVPERFASGHATQHWTWRLALAAACAMHAFVGAALLSARPSDDRSGGGGQYLEAVSVELVTSPVLESASNQPAADGGGASASPAEQSEPVRQPEKLETVAEQDAASPIEKPVQPPSPASPSQPESTTRAIIPTPNSGAAGASAGEINRYAMQVRAALARSKPRGERNKGSVTIVFGIAEDGGVRFARVTAGSGAASLDAAALVAVQRTRFPPPPAAMSEEQRTYTIPFHFR